jgi:dethiobiotin synthetase
LWTIADLPLALPAPAVVVVRAGLGTLNHTALTLEAQARRGIAAQVVIGARRNCLGWCTVLIWKILE